MLDNAYIGSVMMLKDSMISRIPTLMFNFINRIRNGRILFLMFCSLSLNRLFYSDYGVKFLHRYLKFEIAFVQFFRLL